MGSIEAISIDETYQVESYRVHLEIRSCGHEDVLMIKLCSVTLVEMSVISLAPPRAKL